MMENCECKGKCLSTLSPTVRELIYKNFQNLSTNNEKFLYFSGLIYKTAKKKTVKRKSKADFSFHLRVDGYHIQVCQKTFEIIHGIPRHVIRKLLRKLSGNGNHLDYDDAFAKPEKSKPNARSESTKKLVEEHVKCILAKAEVQQKISKGEKPNFSMIYEDYKMMLETRKRMATIDFDDQLMRSGNEETSVDYNPVSSKTYVSLFWELYPNISEELQKECSKDLSQNGRSKTSFSTSKTLNCRNVTNTKKVSVRKLKNLNAVPILSSLVKRPSCAMKNCVLLPEDRNSPCVEQPNSLGMTTEYHDGAVIHVLPSSAQFLTNVNVTHNIIEMVYHV